MKKTLTTNAAPKRLQLLDAARDLFLKEGFFTVAMNKIACNAGISKKTVYHFYNSREALIAATVTHDFEAWNEWFFDAVREHAKSGATMIDAFYKVLGYCTEAPEFRGCLFARVLFAPDMTDDTVRAAAIACADHLYTFFHSQLRKAGVQDSGRAARLQTVYVLLLLGGITRALPGNIGTQLARDARRFAGKMK